MSDMWTPQTASHPLAGRVSVPGSKSEANRALLLAALGDAPSTIDGLPTSRDTSLMIDALTRLGAGIDANGDSMVVTPPARWRGGGVIDCGLAGTVMRFVPPLAMLANGPIRFVGDARASERPMAGLLDALRSLGATIQDDASHDTDRLPFTLSPPQCWGGAPIVIDSTASSQFVSGLLLAGARYPGGLDLCHVGGPLPSRPHIDMTIAMLIDHGVAVCEPQPNHWIVPPATLRAADAVIEPDLTNAAAFLLAGVVTGGWVEVANWPAATTQPGNMIRGVIKAFGGWTRHMDDGSLRAGADGPLVAADIDLSAGSELTPVVAVMAGVANGTSHLRGIGHIRGHETDRLAAIADALGAVGVDAEILDDGLAITGTSWRHGGVIDSRGDHRMVHLGALLGLVTSGVSVVDPGAVAKTMPDFISRWQSLQTGVAS